VQSKQQRQTGPYRGRRRLPKLPSRRYAAVVSSAFLGALLVTLTVAAVLPQSTTAGNPYDNPALQQVSVQDRLNAADRANRSSDRPGPALSNEQAAPKVWLLPLACNYEITTMYAMRWGEFHYGVDLACAYGTPIMAAADGVVVLAQYYGGFGNCIIIDHGGGIQTIYGHASSLKAHLGDHVKAGDVVSYIGSTGFSTGNHLHYEIHADGKPTDPLKFMLAHGVDIQKKLEAASGATIISN
jgi:murein DD-endopeptidase MepM/ murein hydrolase activator NlpD